MNTLVFDIETVPDDAFLFDDEARAIRYDAIQIPANYKKEGTIEKYRNDRMALDDKMGAICPLNGRIVAIAWKTIGVDDSWSMVETNGFLEKDLLLAFLYSLPEFKCRVAGWRIWGFDLPFIEARCALHGVSPHPWWPGASTPKWDLFDLAEYVQRFSGPNYKLEYWLRRYGIPQKLTTGNMVEHMDKADIKAYVENDVVVESALIEKFLPYLPRRHD